jgi:hypothetical protein
VQLEGLGKLKKVNELIRSQTPNLLACSSASTIYTIMRPKKDNDMKEMI